MLTLGTAQGAINSMGGLVKLQGPIAYVSRRLAYAIRMPTRKQTLKAFVSSGITEVGAARERLRSVVRRRLKVKDMDEEIQT